MARGGSINDTASGRLLQVVPVTGPSSSDGFMGENGCFALPLTEPNTPELVSTSPWAIRISSLLFRQLSGVLWAIFNRITSRIHGEGLYAEIALSTSPEH